MLDTTRINTYEEITAIPYSLKNITAKERRTLSSLILYKASVLRTTEIWVKETAEFCFGVEDLYALPACDYEAVVKFLMEFKG